MCMTLDPSYHRASEALRNLDPQGASAGFGQPEVTVPSGISQAGGAPPTGFAPQQPAPTLPPGAFIPVHAPAAPGVVYPGTGHPYPPAPQAPYAQPGGYSPPGGGYGAPAPVYTAPGTGYQPSMAQTHAYGPGRGSQQQEIPGSTRSWAISAIVLGILFAATTGLGMLGIAAASMSGMGASGSMGIASLLSILQLVIAVMFIAGGSGVISAKSWGRVTLVASSAAAIVLVVLGIVRLFTSYPSIASSVARMMPPTNGVTQTVPGMPTGMPPSFPTPGMPPSAMNGAGNAMMSMPTMPNPSIAAGQFSAMLNTSMTIAMVMGGLMFLVQLIYCTLLLLHMKSDPAKEALGG